MWNEQITLVCTAEKPELSVHVIADDMVSNEHHTVGTLSIPLEGDGIGQFLLVGLE